MALMQKLGFTPYAEVCLLVDDLNPARWQGDPAENILTTDDGKEIRVLMDLSCMSCVEYRDGLPYTGVLRDVIGLGKALSGMQTYKLACGHFTI